MFFSLPAEAKILDMDKISLHRDGSGILRVKIEGEAQEYPVKPVRYFPLTGDEHHIGLFKIKPNGTISKEIAFISDLKRLDENSRKLIEEELNKTYPLTQITKILSVKQVGKGLRWHVKTIGEEQTFEVLRQNDINSISPSVVVIRDVRGNRYKINPIKLDKKSQVQLEIYI